MFSVSLSMSVVGSSLEQLKNKGIGAYIKFEEDHVDIIVTKVRDYGEEMFEFKIYPKSV